MCMISRRSAEKMWEKLSSSLPQAQQIYANCKCEVGLDSRHRFRARSYSAGYPSSGSVCCSGAQTATYPSCWKALPSETLKTLRSSSFHGACVPLLGWNAPEIWRERDDLQPCRAILDEDLIETKPTAAIIDGKLIAEKIRQEIAEEIMTLKSQIGGEVPGLAVVLAGSRKDSETYVRSKKKACKEVGIASFGEDLSESCREEDAIEIVRKFNADPSVHGILIQLPLPKHMNEERVLGAVSVEKDVDGFHPLNIGRLAMQGRTPLFVPCTPRGCIELLLRSGVEIKGKHAVVIGRSNVVGTPVALLLQRHQATVTVVHSYTANPAEVTRRADIVIAAVGVAHLVRGDWIKPGAVVIDVGINPIEDPSAKKGYRLVGDVCFKEACTKASAITPVPGGVGPMTIAMLLSNTLVSAKRAYGILN